MTKLIQRIAAGTAITMGLAGAIPQTTKAEKKMEIIYQLNNPLANIMNREVAINLNKADLVVERYTPQYTGDAGVGEILEDSTHIRVGGDSQGSRCITFDSSGNFKGRKTVSPLEFGVSMVKADENGDGHISFEEAHNYEHKMIKRHGHQYPACNSELKQAPDYIPKILPGKNNTA